MQKCLLPIYWSIVATQTGCIFYSNPSYPDKLATVGSNSEICTSLPGNYKNNGEAGVQGYDAPTLTSLLFKEVRPATNIRVTKNGVNSFEFIAESSGTVIASRTITGK